MWESPESSSRGGCQYSEVRELELVRLGADSHNGQWGDSAERPAPRRGRRPFAPNCPRWTGQGDQLLAQDSSMRRAIEVTPGRMRPGPVPPLARAARTSSRWTQRAFSISPSAGTSGVAGSPTAAKPTMSDRGNGQGWLP